MSATDIPTVVGLAFASVTMVLMLPGAVRAWQTYAGVSERRQEDATLRAPLPEGELAQRIAALASLGYRRIGVTWTSTPSGGGFAWVLTSRDEGTYVLLAAALGRHQGLTGFYTTWPDGEWLGTLNPFGSDYQTPGLRIRTEKGTLAAAEARHRSDVAAESARHGSPRKIAGIADMLALDAEYRTRFGGRELRPRLIRELFPVAVSAFLVVFFVVALFVLP